ncbi:hypothetical protein [Deinococcus peraridilitoris]|uniref:Uncharacterized protein n=1 Tax=Deinococcus peraridilitoris (strain DSM 19664 / LMG 22246 / CIP 109416 / KR-200) TaxID=937777 RepID=L0A1D7_DEIPD|nr:hypothetical protein [Deinococcus peraridilitoris]AFZ67631.1 hypothetical protein Deipe_2141 [Deinococcus peraridilitoris DSM 19664]
MARAALEANPMMAHLLRALDGGQDIGEYGRRIVTSVGRHFLSEDELLGLLSRNVGEGEARNLLHEVVERREYPPRRGKIVEYMKRQAFPILPDLHDPGQDDVYAGLVFPPEVAAHIPRFETGRGHEAVPEDKAGVPNPS